MKQRATALLLVCCLLLCATACRVRVDLTQPETGETTATTATTLPQSNDEMAAQAWRLYNRALELEQEYDTYELNYEAKQIVGRETAVTKARFVRVQEGESVSLLIEKESRGTYSMGYFANGIGYFHVNGQKYWLPTDEETVYETLGFSESENLAEDMFTNAIAVKDPDGTTTVSCPLSGKFEVQFVHMMLGDIAMGATITRAESGVTVDAEGKPLSFTSAAAVNHAMYGAMSVVSENRYVAFDSDVVLTPPDDLDTYSSIVE